MNDSESGQDSQFVPIANRELIVLYAQREAYRKVVKALAGMTVLATGAFVALIILSDASLIGCIAAVITGAVLMVFYAHINKLLSEVNGQLIRYHGESSDPTDLLN